jgi:hypothetical protein
MQKVIPERKTYSTSEHFFNNLKNSKIVFNNGDNISVLHQIPSPLLPQVSVNGVQRAITIMDLGKLLLQASRDGNISKVRDLIGRGAPFTTDWVSGT